MKGVLLVNTGSPKGMTRQDVKSFVKSMLMDPMVMTVPDWFRPILVKGIILPFRQFKATARYAQIWDYTHDKSPLIYNMEQLGAKLETLTGMPVSVAMRYEEPSIHSALDELNSKSEELTEVIVLPLFPHYAESSYATTVEEVKRVYNERAYSFSIRFIEPFFNHPAYINTLVEHIRPYVKEGFDKLIFNYHSLPLSHIEKGSAQGKEFDYVYQTKETSHLIIDQLKIDSARIRQTYSSAMSSGWLQPDINSTVADLAKNNKKKIIVVSPGFCVDNLETLYDIGIVAREVFLKNEGQELIMVPCLNDENNWVKAIQEIIQ